MNLVKSCLFSALLLALASCDSQPTEPVSEQDSKAEPIFKLLPKEEHGITFRNDIKEDIGLNYMTYDGIYQGAGIAIADFNNDGLDDLFITANQGENQIYLNQGELKFENVTKKCGIKSDDRWFMSATVADVDNNGFLDIYMSAYLFDEPERRRTSFT